MIALESHSRHSSSLFQQKKQDWCKLNVPSLGLTVSTNYRCAEGKGCFSEGVKSCAREAVVLECKASYLESGVSLSQAPNSNQETRILRAPSADALTFTHTDGPGNIIVSWLELGA